MQGRNILYGVVILHETSYELHSKRLNEIILKLYFEKTYDKLSGLSFSGLSELKVFLMSDAL
jgi:hypothetical protein